MTLPRAPHVAFVCPFNLDRLTGTPIRARLVVEAAREVIDAYVLATGGSLPGLDVLAGASEPRPDRDPRFRLDRFTRDALRRLLHIAPDVVHAMTTAAAFPSLLYKLRRPRARVVFEMHGLSWYEMTGARMPMRIVFAALDLLGLRFADVIIAMSHSQRTFLSRRFRVTPSRIHVMWGAVDLELFPYRPPSSPPPFLVGYLGNDAFWQGLDTAIAAARLLQGDSDIHFLFGGFDPKPYQRQGMRNVTFVGRVSRLEVPEFLARCHVLLSPRRGGLVADLQYPHKLSDYLAAGRPIIASACSDQPMILTQADCGLIVPPQSPPALTAAIRDIRGFTEVRRSEMGRNARRFAETHLSKRDLPSQLLRLYSGDPTTEVHVTA